MSDPSHRHFLADRIREHEGTQVFQFGVYLSSVPGVISGFCIVSCFPHGASQGRPGRHHHRQLQRLRLVQPHDFRALARDGRVHVRERRLTCLAHGCGHLCPSGGRSQQCSGCCDFWFLHPRYHFHY